jgi:uncharacterized membrane protein YesL
VRAFMTVWRACVSYYNELFLFVGLSLLWWITGGIFVGAAVVVGWPLLQIGGPFWLAPLVAIPAGPASAALAYAARRAARELRVDRSFYWEGWRMYWRQALIVNAVSMAILALLLLNLVFYATQQNLLQALTFFFFYLTLSYLGVQAYLFPVLVGLKKTSVWGTLRTAVALALANPIYTLITVILILALTALSVVIAILVLMAWPVVVALIGEHSLLLFIERSGGKPDDDTAGETKIDEK